MEEVPAIHSGSIFSSLLGWRAPLTALLTADPFNRGPLAPSVSAFRCPNPAGSLSSVHTGLAPSQAGISGLQDGSPFLLYRPPLYISAIYVVSPNRFEDLIALNVCSSCYF